MRRLPASTQQYEGLYGARKLRGVGHFGWVCSFRESPKRIDRRVFRGCKRAGTFLNIFEVGVRSAPSIAIHESTDIRTAMIQASKPWHIAAITAVVTNHLASAIVHDFGAIRPFAKRWLIAESSRSAKAEHRD